MTLSPYAAETRSQREKFGKRKMWQDARIKTMLDMFNDPALPPRLRSKFNEVMSRPANYTLVGPPADWNFPPYYVDPEGNAAISNQTTQDLRSVVDYGVRYALFKDENAAAQAAKIIEAYADIPTFTSTGDSALAFYRRWPLLIQAAYLLTGSAAYTVAIDNKLKATTIRAVDILEKISQTRTNNWNAVGATGEILFGAFLNDRTRFDRGIGQWRKNLDDALVSGYTHNGATYDHVPVHEIFREENRQGNGAYGMVYTNMTLSAFAMGAEYARLNGEWLFDHVTPDGSSLKGFYENTVRYARYGSIPGVMWFNTSRYDKTSEFYNNGKGAGYGPLTYITPWVDILGALWPNDDVKYLQDNTAYIPAQDLYTLRNAELFYRNRPLYG